MVAPRKEGLVLEDLFPRKHTLFLSLPLVGPLAGEFADWLRESGYTRLVARIHVRFLPRLARRLGRHVVRLEDVTHDHLDALWRWYRRRELTAAGAVRAFHRFLDSRRLLRPRPEARPTRSERILGEYAAFLSEQRGLAPRTIRHHVVTGAELLGQVGYERLPGRLRSLSSRDLEGLVRRASRRLARPSLQHFVAQIRGFIRFLAASGRVRMDLDKQIDTPRVYRMEQLPRSLPWRTVEAFLSSIDRATPGGARDYAMFLLMTTYGLRRCEVARLALEDIDWRERTINVQGRKNRHAIVLPLMGEVGAAIVRYIRSGRPKSSSRAIFLRARAPNGPLKPGAIGEAFRGRARRGGLIDPQGPHCLRHSFAVHLLRQGTSLKAIGDLLGHRTAEATCVYLRLSTDDLRSVALPFPVRRRSSCKLREVQS